MPQEDDLVGQIFGWVGTALSIFFLFAPAVPFRKLMKEEITYKDSPGLLLVFSFLNCILWADYGLINNKAQMYVANGVGGVITIVWITIYLIYFCGKRFILSFFANLGSMLIVSGITLLFFFIVPVKITGYIVMVFNILMYAAPGEKMVRVFKTGNYNLIPIVSSFSGLACSACWFIYGFYIMDWNVLIPNGLGLLFAVLQIIVYIYFAKKEKSENKGLGDVKDAERIQTSV